MFRMFTVGEIATNSPHANVGNCNSTTVSKTGFASECAIIRHLLLALIYSSNAMKCVKVVNVLTEVETC